MTVFAALLRAVNVGGTGLIRMAELKADCEELGFRHMQTLLQSGNVVFDARGSDKSIATKLADAIEQKHKFRPAVVIRPAIELADVLARNPFPEAARREPNRLIVAFLAGPPTKGAAERIAAVKVDKESLHLSGQELYAHFPNGQGTSKVTNAVLERALGVPATARNWNTIAKLLALSRGLET